MATKEVKYLKKPATFGEIWWSKDRNPSRRGAQAYGTKNELSSLRKELAKGWSPQEDVVVEKILPEEVEAAIKDLEAKHANISAIANAADAGKEDQRRLKYFKECYVDAKGNIRPPKWIGVTCNRRSTQYLEAMVERGSVSNVDDESEREPVWDVPVKYPDSKDQNGNPGRYVDDDTRLREQILENERKTAGFKAYSDADRLWSARKMVEDYGHTQNDLRTTFKSSKGVQFYYLVMLSLYEEGAKWLVNLFNRLMKTEGEDAIPINKLKYGELQKIGPRMELPTRFERKNQLLREKGDDELGRPTKSEFEGWLQKQVIGGTGVNAPKIMDKGQIDTLSNTCRHEGAKRALQAVMKNDKAILDKLYERAEGHNALDHLTMDVFQELEAVLVLFEKISIDDQKAAVAAFRDSVATFPAITVVTASDDSDSESTEASASVESDEDEGDESGVEKEEANA